jgi:hypothetical protein
MSWNSFGNSDVWWNEFDVLQSWTLLTVMTFYLLTLTWWYSFDWSLTAWILEQLTESFTSRSTGSEKFQIGRGALHPTSWTVGRSMPWSWSGHSWHLTS